MLFPLIFYLLLNFQFLKHFSVLPFNQLLQSLWLFFDWLHIDKYNNLYFVNKNVLSEIIIFLSHFLSWIYVTLNFDNYNIIYTYSDNFWILACAFALSTPNSFSKRCFYSLFPLLYFYYRLFSATCSSSNSFNISEFCFWIKTFI